MRREHISGEESPDRRDDEEIGHIQRHYYWWLREIRSEGGLAFALLLIVLGLVLWLLPTGGEEFQDLVKNLGLSGRAKAVEDLPAVLGLLFLSLGGFSLFYSALRRSNASKQALLKMIAWRGVGDQEVVRSYTERKITVLEYVRGIDKASHLRYAGSYFDILVGDVEFLGRHNSPRGKLVNLSGEPEYHELWDKIWKPIGDQVCESCARQHGPRIRHVGIPIRFGLNDLVVGRKSALGLESHRDYSDFALNRLIQLAKRAGTQKIGLWDWYLPTLAVLLLCEGVTTNRLWDERAGTGTTLDAIATTIVKNCTYFRLFEEPDEATDALVRGDVFTVLGAGGWLMRFEDSTRLEAIVPASGALVWVECASIIPTVGNAPEYAVNFIRYLLQDESQLALTNRPQYRAFPATHSALMKAANSSLMTNDFNLAKVYNNQDPERWQSNMLLRRLPDDWRGWENCWDAIRQNL